MARNKNPEITINRIIDTSMQLFLEKGYDNTTIQDIVDALGDLSKGAIYHHFRSKEKIIEAAIPRLYKGDINEVQRESFNEQTGLEKLNTIIFNSLKNPGQEKLAQAAPNLMKNPKFFTQQIYESIEKIVPTMIQPIIEEGIQDGSIISNNPKELAETFIILTNIWMNPAIFNVTKEDLRNKFLFLKELLANMGMPVLSEDIFEIMEKYRFIIEKSQK